MVPKSSSVEEDEFAQVVGENTENSKALSTHSPTTKYIQIPKTRSSVRLREIDLIMSS